MSEPSASATAINNKQNNTMPLPSLPQKLEHELKKIKKLLNNHSISSKDILNFPEINQHFNQPLEYWLPI